MFLFEGDLPGIPAASMVNRGVVFEGDLTGIPAASMVNRGVAKLFRSRVDFPPPLIHDGVQSTAHPSPCSPFRTCCKFGLLYKMMSPSAPPL